MRPQAILALLSLASLGLACSSSDSGDGNAADLSSGIAVEGESPLFPGFSYDTGLQPKVGPAQVSFKASIAGALHSKARAQIEGGKAVGVKGSGKLEIDLHAKLAGRLKVTSTLKSYDGEIPGLAGLDIAAIAGAPFEPFLLGDGESVEAVANVPETKLPDVPLGSVPGHLELTIKAGSTVNAKLRGTCLSGADSMISFMGATTTSGTLVLQAKLVLDLPKPLDQTVTLPDISIALPETNGALESKSAAVSAPAFTEGASCGAPPPVSPPGTDPNAPTVPGGQCTTLANDGPQVTIEQGAGLLPVAAGGTIADGTYVLTSARYYTSKVDTSIPLKRTLKLAAGKFEVVTDAEDEKTAYSGVYIANGKVFTRSFTCPADDTQTDAPDYTATASSLVLIFTSNSIVYTYSKK